MKFYQPHSRENNLVGPYRLTKQIGQGGMGTVYKALDTRLDRYIALKFLKKNVSNDDSIQQRFITEARAASSLDHPNICTIYDIGETDDQQLYIAMALYEGGTLDKRLTNNFFNIDESLDIILQIASGLEAAHSHGIIHRDIKPSNIIFKNNQIIILDFGIAKVEDNEAGELTETGVSLGTVSFSSPEQLEGKKVNQQTDIWSLGIIAYEIISGHRPFKGESPYKIMHDILHQDPIPIHTLDPSISKELSNIISQMLKRDRSDRYQSMQSLISDLSVLKTKNFMDTTQVNKPYATAQTPSTSNCRVKSTKKSSAKRIKYLLFIAPVITIFLGIVLNQQNNNVEKKNISEQTPYITSNLGNGSLIDRFLEAAKNGQPILVNELLIDKNIAIDVTDEMGWTALIHASWQGHPNVVSTLLNAGSDPNVNESKALTVSVVRGYHDIVKMLLSSGANPNALDDSTAPVLMLAIASSSPQRDNIVRELLLSGANPNHKAWGKSAFDLAREIDPQGKLQVLLMKFNKTP